MTPPGGSWTVDGVGAEGESPVAVIPVPVSVAGCRDFRMSLSGTWNFTSDAPEDLCRTGNTKGAVERVIVPGSLDSQGMRVIVPVEQCGGAFDSQDWSRGSVPCAYHRSVSIPESFEGKRIFLKVAKAAATTEVWFDGELIRTHIGGHAEWDCELTSRAVPGTTHDLALHLQKRERHTRNGVHQLPWPHRRSGSIGASPSSTSRHSIT